MAFEKTGYAFRLQIENLDFTEFLFALSGKQYLNHCIYRERECIFKEFFLCFFYVFPFVQQGSYVDKSRVLRMKGIRARNNFGQSSLDIVKKG